MNYYIDITLLPDPEITLSFIQQKVYQQVHIALAENKVEENSKVSEATVGEFTCYGLSKETATVPWF